MSKVKGRIANAKTKSETGFDFVMENISPDTPLGRNAMKETGFFLPGEEAALNREFDKLEGIIDFILGEPKKLDKIRENLHCIKDITSSIEGSSRRVLTAIEIYEIKSLLIYSGGIRKAITEGGESGLSQSLISEEFIPEDQSDILDILDPKGDRINTFYIYDEYSEELKNLRARKKELDVEIRTFQRKERDRIKDAYGISLTPKFDIVLPKSSEKIDIAKELAELEQIAEDYSSITFALSVVAGSEALYIERDELALAIEAEEDRVRADISNKIGAEFERLLETNRRIGLLDFFLAKGFYAIKHNLVRPTVSTEHVLNIENGRHLQVESILNAKGKDYMPISINLTPGVTCITGANMGGKTISLKLVGLIALLAQYGYFVPCDKAEIGLSSGIRLLVGDSQSVERGLSSFGSEMEEFKEIMDQADDRALILIDEIASGTNPVEGLALTKSIVDYLEEKPYITLLTTHYDGVTMGRDIANIQVKGLADADFKKLNSRLSLANRKERIEIIGEYMDYSLIPVKSGNEIPKDAINIARMLGIEKSIIDRATEYIKGDANEE